MLRIVLTLIIFSLVGCSTNKVYFSVLSDPERAQVDINGKKVGQTPTKISLECSREWVGVMVAPGGWLRTSDLYEVKVHPPVGLSGQSQSQFVDPCKWSGSYEPTLNYEFRVVPQEINLAESIQSLKILRDRKILTEKEYQEKILKLTK